MLNKVIIEALEACEIDTEEKLEELISQLELRRTELILKEFQELTEEMVRQ